MYSVYIYLKYIYTDWYACMGYSWQWMWPVSPRIVFYLSFLRDIHICRYFVYISIYLVPDIYTTAWQALKRCVFQYKQTKTWRANKEDSKCLTQHEKIQKKWYLCISRRIIGLLTSDIIRRGSMPVTLPYIFDILLI